MKINKNIEVLCECGSIVKTQPNVKAEEGFKCFCGRPIDTQGFPAEEIDVCEKHGAEDCHECFYTTQPILP